MNTTTVEQTVFVLLFAMIAVASAQNTTNTTTAPVAITTAASAKATTTPSPAAASSGPNLDTPAPQNSGTPAASANVPGSASTAGAPAGVSGAAAAGENKTPDSAEGQQSVTNSSMLAIIIVPLVVAVLVAVTCVRVVCKRSSADKLQEENDGTQDMASPTSGDGGSKIPGSPFDKGMQDFASLTSPLSSPSLRSVDSPECFDDDLASAAYREAGVTVDVADVVDGSPTLSPKGCEPNFVFDVSSLRLTWSVQRAQRVHSPAEGEEEDEDKRSSANLEAGEGAVALTSAVISEKITAVYAENIRRITEAEDILASVRDFLSARHSSRLQTGETGHEGREEGKVSESNQD